MRAKVLRLTFDIGYNADGHRAELRLQADQINGNRWDMAIFQNEKYSDTLGPFTDAQLLLMADAVSGAREVASLAVPALPKTEDEGP